MSKVSSVIQINGTTYDAASGNVVGAAKKVAYQFKEQSRVIDGFIKKSSTAVPRAAKASVGKISTRADISRVNRISKQAQAVHSRTQRSKALVRASVTKPKTGSGSVKSELKPNKAEQDKLFRASSIALDPRVKRFGSLRGPKTSSKSVVTATARPMSAPSASHARSTADIMPSMIASASHEKLEEMLDEALMRADSHKQQLKRAKNPLYRLSKPKRILVLLVMAIVFFVVAGFIIWKDMPQVAIRIAGQRAHIEASLPAYTPSGFNFVKADFTSNAVAIHYQAMHASRLSYLLTQEKSAWDSTSLASNAIESSQSIQTSQVQGTTVYIYGSGNDATWVNNGIRYTLQNKANLSSDQILHIVQSM